MQRLEPRSLVLMYGDARWRWRHGIAKRPTDTWGGHKVARRLRESAAAGAGICVSPGSRPRHSWRSLGQALRGLRLARRATLRESYDLQGTACTIDGLGSGAKLAAQCIVGRQVGTNVGQALKAEVRGELSPQVRSCGLPERYDQRRAA